MPSANDTTPIILTRENLHALASKADGFTAATIHALGVPWPPRKGWLSALIGQSIPDTQYQKALEGRCVKAKSSRRDQGQTSLGF